MCLHRLQDVVSQAEFQLGLKKRQRRLRALILVGAVSMQTVTTSSGHRVINGKIQIVTSKKPFKRSSRFLSPALVSCDAGGLETGGHHGLSFHRLLVESCTFSALMIKAVGADRHKVSSCFVGALQVGEPAERFQRADEAGG